MEFVNLTEENKEVGFQIQSAAFNKEYDDYAREWFPHIIKRSDYVLALAEDQGEPIGLIGAMIDIVSPATYALGWVSIKPEFQGKGFGKQMIDGFGKYLKKTYKSKGCSFLLSTEDHNQNLYKKLGFELQGKLHDGSSLMMKIVG